MTAQRLLISVEIHGVVQRVGTLYANLRQGREHTSFEYEPSWLSSPLRFALTPALQLSAGPFVARANQQLPGAIADSAPDRWGRTLMLREERRQARIAHRAARAMMPTDFLLAVHDVTRQGALRFQRAEDGPFVAESGTSTVPPQVRLAELLAASEQLETDESNAADEALALLLAPGSSLGGARPKASVIGAGGSLWMAKFPKHDDECTVEGWEAVALTLAKRAGITVPDFEFRRVSGKGVLLLRRFDRAGAHRIPYLSAMSMLDALDGEARSYVEIAEALRQYGAAPRVDLAELFRRVVFNILIANLDDHLRNHGFLLDGPSGWRLAPAFDLNPVPADVRPRFLTTSVDIAGDTTASLEVLRGVEGYFGLSAKQAAATIVEVRAVVTGWRKEARALRLSAAECERMASAFEAEV